jgi:hypothetical protein
VLTAKSWTGFAGGLLFIVGLTTTLMQCAHKSIEE